MQFVVAGYGLALVAGLIAAGRLGDLYGRRRLFMIGTALFTIASAACGRAPNASFLVGGRVVQGLGAALLTPQVLAIINTVYKGEHRAKAFNAYGLAIGFGGVFGQLASELRYELRFHGPGEETETRTVGEWTARSAVPVTEPDRMLVVSDPDGRSMAIVRGAGDSVRAEVTGLGITDRLLIARLPVRIGTAPGELMAPLRWNQRTGHCEAVLRLSGTDLVDLDTWLEVRPATVLGVDDIRAIAESARRAVADTTHAWIALAADDGLDCRIRTVIRSVLRRS